MTGVPHVERCSVTQRFGEGRHAQWWQCLISPAPHPDRGHYFGIDAEVYGRDLDAQDPAWLAATLRDAEARARHQQRRLDEITAHAARLARIAAELDRPQDAPADTRKWVAANLPVAAFTIGWVDGRGQLL